MRAHLAKLPFSKLPFWDWSGEKTPLFVMIATAFHSRRSTMEVLCRHPWSSSTPIWGTHLHVPPSAHKKDIGHRGGSIPTTTRGCSPTPNFFQKSFRNPNPYWSRKKYGSTPPICTAARPPFVSLGLPGFQALKKGKPNSTPPICTALRLPFVRQYASHLYGSTFEKILHTGGWGHQKSAGKVPKIITSHDVLEPLKQVLSTSRDVIISGQICGSKLQRVFTLGDGCWLPPKKVPDSFSLLTKKLF